MTPITHILASWTTADIARLRERDAGLVTLSGILPDADGLGLAVDIYNRLLGRGNSYYYFQYHHQVLHGIFGAIVIPAALCIFAKNRLRMFIVGFLAVHLHLLCDFVGSRGPDVEDIWPIAYLGPFSTRWTVQWSGQWRIDSWPNFAFTMVLLGYIFVRAVRSGYLPLRRKAT